MSSLEAGPAFKVEDLALRVIAFRFANKDPQRVPESPCDPEANADGWSDLPRFDSADVGRMYVGRARQRLLRKALLKPRAPQRNGEGS
jgi:hypothetical protein